MISRKARKNVELYGNHTRWDYLLEKILKMVVVILVVAFLIYILIPGGHIIATIIAIIAPLIFIIVLVIRGIIRSYW